MQVGTVASINVSRGGVPKHPVASVLVTASGLEGDEQRDLRFHGGPDRAVSLFSLEIIDSLCREGHPIGVGTAGENLTVSGLDWSAMVPGSEIAVGDVRLRITGYAAPCSKIQASFLEGDFTRISDKTHPGSSRLYARVLAGGVVRTGDPVSLVAEGKVPGT